MLPPGRPLGVPVTFDHTEAMATKQCCAWECRRGSHRLKNQTVVTPFLPLLSLAAESWDLG